MRLVLLLSLCTLCAGCWDRSQQEREATEAELRSERLRRVHEAQARERLRKRWHDRYRRQIARATGVRTVPARPPTPCDPWAEFRRRAEAPHHLSIFADAVGLVLRPLHAGHVLQAGQPRQRFTFAVRMHPDDEPALGRKRSRGELTLDLRWVPLCPQGTAVMHIETLRLRLARHPPRSAQGVAIRPHEKGRLPRVPVGVPVALLLDPTRASLSGRGDPATRSGAKVGLWEIVEARFPGRARLRRLAQQTSAFGPRLARLHTVEVACPGPGGTCRFLTIARGLKEAPLTLAEMLKLAAPIRRPPEARQLFQILMSLKYPRCHAHVRRPPAKGHLCLLPGGPSLRVACAFWRAQHGFRNPLRLQSVAKGYAASQVITCQGKTRRVLRLEATFQPNGDFQLRESDLTARAAELEAELRALGKGGMTP